MPSFTQLFTLATLAMVSFAAITSRSPGHPHCPGAKLVDDSTVDVHGSTVHLTSYSCGAKPVPRGSPAPTNVCGASCTNSCNKLAGVLPPVSQDCDMIEAAIQIFAGITSTFTVDSNHLQTLTFGTCKYFFSNTGSSTLQYCWSDLNSTAIAAGAGCFPPVQPFSSEGLCTSYNDNWAVGASHS